SLVWSWIGQLNQRIVAEAPWEAVKDPERRTEIHQFLYRLLEAIRLIAVLLWPVMPQASRRIFVMLGLPDTDPMPDALHWGVLQTGHPFGPIQPLFPRIDVTAGGPPTPRPSKEKTVSEPTKPAAPPAVPPAAAPPVEKTQAASPAGAQIDIDDFAKIELRAARVVSAEKIAGSRKLLRLQVDLGDEQRQIVSGISDAYEPEALVGKKIVLVANLKPAKLMGVESNGMVLAASVDGRAVLCTFDADVAPGTKVK
ncbi:MAG TPA: methionine--tRNA ligase subunit beta, partial [Vicinamibacteria bacterium]|nr:methionine--tRNA ligase subunit beta [Vicinamibacteria bacterium]